MSDTAIRSPLLRIVDETGGRKSSVASSVSRLLKEQQDLTAVDRFARAHEEHAHSTGERYRHLMPVSPVRPGEQYAFEVDLDRCTGCKACVTGCHSLNGLDDGEAWRTVGLLVGGSPQAATLQTVTTSCHHCLEPACMAGCPVKAYEKDAVTGIVKHLDDQCIGCQYCLFMCPYDAPKYSRSRGIVRKCDMCSSRLAVGEAPACVQSCPNEAIRITVVDEQQVVQQCDADGFLPGAPGPADTLPTTVYKSSRAQPKNLLPADYYSVTREHAHPALVLMLVLTQLSVGAFCLEWLLSSWLGDRALSTLGMQGGQVALGLGLAALGASVFHLGRPQFAFRAVLGLGTSWLSREILGFSLFAALAALYAGSSLVPDSLRLRSELVGAGASLCGLVAVFFSVMVYVATRRPHWRGSVTGLKFFGTTIIAGTAAALLVNFAFALRHAEVMSVYSSTGALKASCLVMCAVAAIKLLADASVLVHLKDRQHSPAKRMAIVSMGDLRTLTTLRFVLAFLGGVVGPLCVLSAAPDGLIVSSEQTATLFGIAIPTFICVVLGELFERYLFFAAAPASRMPGGLH